MKRLVLTILLILLGCNNLWGLKEWSDLILSSEEKWNLDHHCGFDFFEPCKIKMPTLPNDYKPTKEDKVLKVKVGNVEGEIVGVKRTDEGRNWFIRSSKGNYKYIGSLFDGKDMLINYPNYAIMAHSWDTESGIKLTFYQIFQVGNELKIFGLDNVVTLCGNFYGTDPCPNPLDYFNHLSTQDILKKIEKLGGQELFDNACPSDTSAGVECENGLLK